MAAVILAIDPGDAVAEVAGRAAALRIVEAAWAGGAIPLILVSPDPDGAVSAAIAGTEAVLAPPTDPTVGAAGALMRGSRAATDLVAGTGAVLMWPVTQVWVEPETVTLLIEAHGLDPESCLRPTWDATDGWPVLLPLSRLGALAGLGPDRTAAQVPIDLERSGAPFRRLDLGDPGSVLDRAHPVGSLPPYTGPAGPLRTPPDWGAAAAEGGDDGPVASVRRVVPDGEG